MNTTVATPRDADTALVVLFVEDDKDTRDLYELVFRDYGLIPRVAHTGREGLAKTNELRPDVVVLDIVLPDIDGFEVCRTLKDRPATASIPVIAATGYWRPGVLTEARDAGFAAFLLKPHAPRQLFDAIRRVADQLRRSTHACRERIHAAAQRVD